MSFLDLLALRKAKLGGKYQAPEGQRGDQDAGEVEEEVRGDVGEEVREKKTDPTKSGENKRKNMASNRGSIVKRLEPTMAPENGTIKTSAGFMLVDQSDHEEPTVEVVEEVLEKGKKRTMSERLQEPIKVKKAGRCKKVNVTSWRNQVLTMKKKASRMQIEAGAQPNFLIIMFNNVQDPHASNPSASAGKYLTYGEGPIKEKLIKEGLKFDKSMYLMANNFNFAEEKVLDENSPEEDMGDELLVEESPEMGEEETRVKRMRIGSQTAERRIGETQKVSELSRKLEAREDTFGAAPEERGHTEAVKEAQRREKVVPSKWVPKKVATPGTFFDTMRMSSSEEED